MLRVLLFVTTLIVSSLPTSSVMANETQPTFVSFEDQDEFVRGKIRKYFGHNPLIEIIAGCESTGNPRRIEHWNDNGKLVKNPSSSASGALQVLLQYHGDWINDVGVNMQDIDGYMKFAAVLYKSQGYGAWNESRSCWGKFANLGA